MVYAKQMRDGRVTALYKYNFAPSVSENSGIEIITESEYLSLLEDLNPTPGNTPDTDQISDSEALAIITGEVNIDDAR